MDPSLVCKLFFSLGIAVDLGGTLIPSFRAKIMNYGSRSTTQPRPSTQKAPATIREALFTIIASMQVPHTWFTHYYIVSVLSSLFWAHQIYTRGPIFELLASYAADKKTSMTVNQVVLAWGMMTTQGLRRLYESVTLTKPSNSKMWVGLWAIGIAYYAFMGISVWIEGIDVLTRKESIANLLEFSEPSIKTLIAIATFVTASWIQHDCHVYLGSLRKYTLPEHGFFKYVTCPHYTSECVLYIAIAIVAAPKGQWLNGTVLAGFGFVASNLAVTADSTKKWYVEKFGAAKVAGRWRMIPNVY